MYLGCGPFNEGRPPTEEEYRFMMRVADKDHDGRINLGELHYAIRAWHSYCNLDDNVLRLFAEFDVDHSGRLDEKELGQLLTELNGGKPVPTHEVQRVMIEGDVIGDGAINRSELLGAVAAWYARVDRKETDIPSLLREAMVRTAKDSDHLDIFEKAQQSATMALNHVRGVHSGYSQVGSADTPEGIDLASYASRSAPAPPVARTGWSSPDPLPEASDGMNLSGMVSDPTQRSWQERLMMAKPLLSRSCAAFCYVSSPFLVSIFVFWLGWTSRRNECPRNLDGILMWFGFLAFCFSVSMYVNSENEMLGKIRIALAVIIAVLNLVGICWVSDKVVLHNKLLCGHLLVWWSLIVWYSLPVFLVVGACYYGMAHYQRLQSHESALQKELVL